MDVRKTPQRLTTLEVLAALGESHGFEIATRASLKLGTVYGVLMAFEQAGAVQGRWEEGSTPGRPPRKRYRLTDEGQALLAEYRAHFGPKVRRNAFAAVTGELHTAIDLLWGGMFRAASRPELTRQAADTARRDAVAQRLAKVTGGKAGDGRALD
jgi:DNA-binding PadR family transcriptional regulator